MSIIEDIIGKDYEVKGTFQVDTDSLTKMGFTTQSINSTEREDKSVVITSNGQTKQVSSMMFGYNKAKIKLKDGNFANSEELMNAMKEAVARQEKGTIVVNSKGEKLTAEKMEELISVVVEAAGKVVIGGQSSKITNQTAPTWGVEGPTGKVHSKGAVFLGNGQIKLPSGEYVSVDELNQAISDYMIVVPKKEEPIPVPPKPIEPQPQTFEQDKKKLLKVTRKYKNNASKWLAGLAATLAIVLAIGTTTKPIEVVETFDRSMVEYEMTHSEVTEEGIEQIKQDMINQFCMGGNVFVEDSKTFRVTSNPEDSRTKTMGEEFTRESKTEGDYRISGFAVWHDGKLYDYIEDFNGKLTDPTIGQYIDDVCMAYNLPKDEIDFMVHVGVSHDNTRLGWIDVSELVNQDELNFEIIDYIAENTHNFKDTIDNFTGTTVTLSNGDVISVYNPDGTLIQPGQTIVSEKGVEYTVNNFELTTTKESVTNIVGEEKQLVFDLTAPEIAIAMSPLVAALALGIANHKKNKKAEQNPNFVSVANNEEKEKFVRDFVKAKEEYEKKSNFGKVLQRIFYRKEIDQMRELTDEQIREIYESIERHANKDFVFGSNDTITFKNGNIYVQYHDGKLMNITDIVMEDIYSVGNQNEVVEEGIYSDEVRRKY